LAVASKPSFLMGTDLELLHHVNAFHSNRTTPSTKNSQRDVREYLDKHASSISQDDIDAAVARYVTQGIRAFEMGLSVRDFTLRLQGVEDIALLDCHSLAAGLRGPSCYTNEPVDIDFRCVNRGDSGFWPRATLSATRCCGAQVCEAHEEGREHRRRAATAARRPRLPG
jgi:hypothetical protein